MTITELISKLEMLKEVYGDCEVGYIHNQRANTITEIIEPYTSYWYFIGDLFYPEDKEFKNRKRVISLL